jgi:tetratricopeptide (TPR) repeat protein
MYIGEFMIIAILKNIDNMSFDKSYLYNVIGMVYYYSGNVLQAEINFDKSIKYDESSDEKKKKSIYTILSLEWIAYIHFYEFSNVDKGKKMYNKAKEQYSYFLKAMENKKYINYIKERQMYAYRLLQR